MSVAGLISELLDAGVELWAEGERLRYRAARGLLTPEQRRRLAEHKAAIVALLGPRRKHALPSFAQQRLWFLDQFAPATAAYNIATAAELRGALNIPAIAAGFRQLARRHEILRTCFTAFEGRPAQVVDLAVTHDLPVVDLTALPAARRHAEARRQACAAANRPFDLATGPLLRTLLLRLAADQHLLLVGQHHLITDGWSLEVLARELAAFYAAALAGRPASLPELAIQYADFARWQRRQLTADGALTPQLAYWRRQLAGLPTLVLPTDRPRPVAQTYRGARHEVRLPAALSAAVRALGQQAGATLHMTLLSAFFVLLEHYTGQRDLAVGSLAAGRNREEIEALLGFFVNSLVLRGDLSGDPNFSELVARTRETVLEAFAHQEYPFEKLVEELQPERDPSRSPLFQVLFGSLRSAPSLVPRLAGIEAEAVEIEPGGARLDLELHLWPGDGGLAGVVLYDPDLFDAGTIGRLSGHFRTLLEGITTDPERRLGELDLLNAPQRHQVLREWNDRPTAVDGRPGLHQLLAARTASSGEAAAVVFGDRHLSYRELHRRSGELARHLRQLGVGPEVFVAVFLERSPDLLVALCGILEAGGAFVPLDPGDPAERLAFKLEDSRAPVVVIHEHLRERLPAAAGRIVVMDGGGAFSAASPAAPRAVSVSPDHPAYMIYTSGSTGRPKGVINTHRAIVNRLRWMQETYRLDPADRVLQKTPTSFDVSVWELFWPLLAGARLVVARPGGHRDGAYLARLIAARGITTVHFVPSMLQVFLDEEQAGGCGCLRRVVASGEALPPELVRRFAERLPGVELHNLYGPTEAAIDVTAHPCDGHRPLRRVPIGRPVANTRIHLLDQELRPVPPGVSAELYIGGVQLARGYGGRPRLTAERFVPDPFSDTGGTRLYRAGDLTRYGAGGEIEFLGRVDHQVKLRGQRLELGEIEAVLAQHPQVREAVVELRELRPRDDGLVGYLVRHGGAGAGERFCDELRDWLATRLPEVMIPAVFVGLVELPLTPSGKVDRAALPAPELRGPGPGEAGAAPRSPVEEILAGIWSRILGIGAPGADANFFALGGHSLLATQVMSRVLQTLHVELPVSTLFEKPNIAGLAERIERVRSRARPPAPPPMPVSRAGGDLPLSFSQQRLWFLNQLEPGSPAWNVPAAFHLEGRFEPRFLAAALGEVVRRHEVLRTTFPSVDGEPRQVISAALRVSLPLVDLSGLAEQRRRAVAQRLVVLETRRYFDLARGPVLRAAVLRLRSREHVLHLNLHHIVSDGWSQGILFRELAALYRACSGGAPSAGLAELPIQYADFAVWQRRWLRGEVLRAQLDYWRVELAGAPVLRLPADRPRPAAAVSRGAYQRFEIPAALAAELGELSRRRGATVFMTLLAAFQGLLSRSTGQRDLSVGSPIAGRTRVEAEPLIGFFLNTLVLRGDLSGDPSFRELLRRTRASALDAYLHQELPFEKLIEELQPERDLAVSPLFQVLFVFQNTPHETLELPGLRTSPWPTGYDHTKYDLTLFVTETVRGLAGDLGYRTELFDATTIRRFAAYFRNLLAGAVAAPARRLSELPFLDRAERHQLVVEGGSQAVDTAPAGCIHELIESRAARSPAAVAMRFGAWQLSYGELDRRADVLASELRRSGVGPEVRVGICLERSLEVVLAILAVLKAGGTYVLIAPDAPPNRSAFMLRDTASRVLITRSSHAAAYAEEAVRLLFVDRQFPEPGRRPSQPRFSPRHLAYVAFTSGSRGRPKAVMTEHRGQVAYLDFLRRRFDLGPADVVLQVAPLSFDMSVRDLLGPLVAGARVVLLRDAAFKDPEALLAAIAEHRVTCLLGIGPTLLAALLTTATDRSVEFSSLRLLVVGGESLPWAEVRRTRRVFGDGVRVVNHYGTTESYGAALELLGDGSGEVGPAPVGRPNPHSAIVLLDPALRPIPLGIPGELHVSGLGLARGYLGHPRLTACRFIPHPWSSAPGERLYRTGDLARRLADGRLVILGRLDSQLKIRGFRIEPGEIEAVLAAHPMVAEAVVIAPEGRRLGARRLVACIVPLAQPGPGSDELRRFLAQRLPEHMIPGRFVPFGSLPRTAHGKVDRRRLPGPEPGRPELATAYVAPRSPVEETLAEIWGQVLGLKRVGADDNFFEIGGDSILSIQIVARANQRGLRITPRNMFENQTVAELARVATAGKTRATPAREPAKVAFALAGLDPDALDRLLAGREDIEDVYPISPTQEGMFYYRLYVPESPAYCNQQLLQLGGRLDAAALRQAWQRLLDRHPSLRTEFAWKGLPRPLQLVRSNLRIPWIEEDLRALTEQERQARLTTLRRRDRAQGFDLTRAPIMRLRLLRLADRVQLLIWTYHHILFDGWSISILIRELAELYGAAVRMDREVRLELVPPFRDFILWHEDQDRSQAEAFWRQALRGFRQATPLPFDREADLSGTGLRVRTVRTSLTPATTAGLDDLARRHHLTLNTILQGAWALVLGRFSGEEDIVFGSTVSGRAAELPGVESMVGVFINTLPVRLAVAPRGRFLPWLQRLQAWNVQMRQFDYGRLFDLHAWSEIPAGEPIYNSALIFQNFPTTTTAAAAEAGIDMRPVGYSGQTSYPLTLMVSPGSRLAMRLSYDCDLFEDVTARRMAAFLTTLLESFLADFGQRLAELPALPAAERHRLLLGCNDSAAPCGGESIPSLFAAQVKCTPEAMALVSAGQQLSYRELDRRADQLARYLRELGVGPESLVGVLMVRSPEMVIALVGVLKAGAGYVPLDPLYPRRRLAFILEETKAPVVLTLERLAAELPDRPIRVVRLDAEWPIIAGEGRAELAAPGPSSSSPAYVIYTSGSTGLPKGVVIAQRSLAAYVETAARDFALTPADRVLQFASISFDTSAEEIFPTLLSGVTLILRSERMLESPAEFLRTCARWRVTVLDLPTAYWHKMTAALHAGAAHLPRSLRLVIIGGESARPGRLAAWYRHAPRSLRLVNTYGPTEATIVATARDLSAPPAAGVPAVVSIGSPIRNGRAHVLDRRLRPVPVGVAGELHLGGPGLARGYLYRPTQTAERFLPDPFSSEPGERLYRTGDRVRRLPGGDLEFLGRLDHQVKVRGLRIELGEIEAVLSRHSAVAEAVAVVSEQSEPRLVACVVPKPGCPAPDDRHLQDLLQEKLPFYMVPAVFEILPSLPLTPNGKVDRTALARRPLPEPDRTKAAEGQAAPRTPTEEAVAEVWSQVLQIDRVGLHDDYFALGGDSLIAVRLMAHLERRFGVEISLAMLFRKFTVEGVAHVIDQLQQSDLRLAAPQPTSEDST